MGECGFDSPIRLKAKIDLPTIFEIGKKPIRSGGQHERMRVTGDLNVSVIGQEWWSLEI